MSSAQLDILPSHEIAEESSSDSTAQLRLQVAERLAAHRSRRAHSSAVAPPAAPAEAHAKSAHPAAATVAARYAQTPSYRAFLADEARRAIQQAAAAAEVAARNAEAVAVVQLQLLNELEDELERETASQQPRTPTPKPAAPALAPRITVRLYEDAGLPSAKRRVEFKDNALLSDTPDMEESLALDEEIAFRQSPVFEAAPEPPVLIPGNLLEFPRQLVASRKSRPRLAEGPLCEPLDQFQPASGAQLRIFEVAPDLSLPMPEPAAVPEWTSIWLDAPTERPVHLDGVAMPAREPSIAVASAAAPVQTAAPALPAFPAFMPGFMPIAPAPISHRLLAATLDAALVFGCLLASVTVFALATGPSTPLPQGRAADIAAAASFVALYILYHLLFFTFSESTPGMSYARLGFCTFADDNPTRAAIRKRLLATAIAASPLGLGILWACLDDERLGWHDRISRIYLRSY
jgi:uncharacterized RDD family membrane protein YckC